MPNVGIKSNRNNGKVESQWKLSRSEKAQRVVGQPT
jgi:hypothetical protein